MAKSTPPLEDMESTETTESAPKNDLRIKHNGSFYEARVLNAEDFKRAGIDDVTKKSWNVDNHHTVNFTEYDGDREALVRFLTESDVFTKGEFRVLDAGEV